MNEAASITITGFSKRGGSMPHELLFSIMPSYEESSS